MKKINRREFLKASGVVAATAALAACSGSASTDSTAASTAGGASSEILEAGAENTNKRVVVAAWEVSETLFSDDTYQGVANVIHRFKQAYPDYEVEVLSELSVDYVTKLTTLLNGGGELDAFVCQYPDNAVTFGGRGQLLDLKPYIDRDGIDLAAYRGFAENFNFDGKQLAMPALLDCYGLCFNKGLFDEAGVAYPEHGMSWEEFEDMAATMTKGEGADKVYGAYCHSWAIGVSAMANCDGKHTICSADQSHLKPYYEMYLRMQADGTMIDYASMVTGSLHYTSTFVTNSYAIMPIGTWYLNNLIGKLIMGDADMEYGMVRFPVTPGVTDGMTTVQCTSYAANANAQNPEAAWDFVKFASGEGGAMAYGQTAKFPALMNDAVWEAVHTVPFLPDAIEEVFAYESGAMERPAAYGAGEAMGILNSYHSLIMLEEMDLDEALAAMGEEIEAVTTEA